MKAPQIVLIGLAFLLGVGAMAAFNLSSNESVKKKELEERLAAAQARVEELEKKASRPATASAIEDADGNGLRSAIPKTTGEEETEEPDKDATPEEQIAKLLNSKEARNLIKGFAGAMTSRADQWIGREINKYKEQFDLTDAQVASLNQKLTAMVKESTKDFQSQLDDESKSFQEIMESQGQFWQANEEKIDAMFKEELNEDQFAQYKEVQLTEKTKRVQRSADRELTRMDEDLELSPAQEDQVFAILVRESPEYDSAMTIEGVETGLPAEATGTDVTKDDAIRAVLTPEQAETYNAKAESGGYGRQRGGPWGGGGFGSGNR